MLPFPIINKTAVLPDNVVLDIDFARQSVGDSTILDEKGHIFSKVGSGTAQVQNDATKGNVMLFSTGTYFSTPIVDDLKFSINAFEIRIVYKSTGTSGEQIVFSTGDYYTVPVGGFMLTLFNNIGTQLFCTDNTGSFTRCIFSYTGGIWRDISFFWTPSTRNILIKDNDTGLTIGNYTLTVGFNDGTQFSIGASYSRGVGVNTFAGSIKSLKILRY